MTRTRGQRGTGNHWQNCRISGRRVNCGDLIESIDFLTCYYRI